MRKRVNRYCCIAKQFSPRTRDRWLKKGKNGINEIGEEKTKRDMKTRIEILKSSQIWSESDYSKFRTWITETWFSCLKVSFL